MAGVAQVYEYLSATIQHVDLHVEVDEGMNRRIERMNK
jgi:hypothetical protein